MARVFVTGLCVTLLVTAAALAEPRLSRERALEIARKEVAGLHWPHGATYDTYRHKGQWHVTAWRIVYPNNKGVSRFCAWRLRHNLYR